MSKCGSCKNFDGIGCVYTQENGACTIGDPRGFVSDEPAHSCINCGNSTPGCQKDCVDNGNWEYIVKKPMAKVQPVNTVKSTMPRCLLCGSLGVDMCFFYDCSNIECKNYKKYC